MDTKAGFIDMEVFNFDVNIEIEGSNFDIDVTSFDIDDAKQTSISKKPRYWRLKLRYLVPIS